MTANDAKAPQPAPRATPRNRRRLRTNKKRMMLLKGISQGLNVSAAGRYAGYGTAQSAHRALNRMALYLPAILEKIGLPAEKVLKKFKELLEAKETKYFSNQGIVTDCRVVPAHDIQLRAAIEVAKMWRVYPRNGQHGDDAIREPRGPIFNLVFNDPERGKRIIEALNKYRSGLQPPPLDAPADEEPEGPDQ